jgi:hypothetical protein
LEEAWRNLTLILAVMLNLLNIVMAGVGFA